MYEVKLPEFVGPLDLLLDLVKREELNISEIPITDIIIQYFNWLGARRKIDLETSGEFLVIISSLMEFKSKVLLPHLESVLTSSEEETQSAFELKKEYQKLKILVTDLEKRANEQSKIFTSPPPEFEKDDYTLDISLFDLLDAFKNLLVTAKETSEEIIQDEVSIEEKKDEILQQLKNNKFLNFKQIFPSSGRRIVLIAIFLALLELIKEHLVRVRQHKLFGNIRIYSTVKSEA